MARILHVRRLPPAQKKPSVRIVGNGRLEGRNDENELATKDPDRRGQYAGGLVIVRMQPTTGDVQSTSSDPGGRRPGVGTDCHQQSAGPHVGFVTAA